MNNGDREKALTLELLEAIEQKSDVTQRNLADRLDVALGLANSYLKRCVRKGLVKIQQVPPNRYLYYLTPKGFREKSRLTAQYLVSSLNIYRRASDGYARVFTVCAAEGRNEVVLCGATDLAEIAAIRAREFGIGIAGIYDPFAADDRALGLPVWKDARALGPDATLVFCALTQPERMYAHLESLDLARAARLPEFLEFVRAGEGKGRP
jgi:DNA-binding MarR family transcriptional regulator